MCVGFAAIAVVLHAACAGSTAYNLFHPLFSSAANAKCQDRVAQLTLQGPKNTDSQMNGCVLFY
eukprot:2123886-Heterocapsa_arctica.AAC.1